MNQQEDDYIKALSSVGTGKQKKSRTTLILVTINVLTLCLLFTKAPNEIKDQLLPGHQLVKTPLKNYLGKKEPGTPLSIFHQNGQLLVPKAFFQEAQGENFILQVPLSHLSHLKEALNQGILPMGFPLGVPITKKETNAEIIF